MRQPLPDPRWFAAADTCIGCGYSLAGLAAPGRCPECGAPFDQRQLILAGVPQRSVGRSPARRLAWVATIICWAGIAQLWPVLMIFSYIPLLAALVAGTGALVWLIVTGPRERRGVERFILSPAGIARVPLVVSPGQNTLDSVFIPWAESDGYYELRRISPVWRRLKVGRAGGPRAPLFDAGVRCPDASEPLVREAIEGFLRPGPPTPALRS